MISASDRDLLERVDEGIDTLEERLAPPHRPLSAEDRVLVTTLLLSLDEVVQRLEIAQGSDSGVLDLDRLADDEAAARAVVQRQRLERVSSEVAAELASVPAHPLGSVAPPLVDAGPVEATRVRRLPGGERVGVLIGQALTLLGLLAIGFLVFAFALSGLYQQRDQRRLRDRLADGFEQGTVAPLEAGAVIPRGEPIARLEIPRLGLEQVVVEGSSPSELERGPGHIRTSPLPGQSGNAIVLGKRSTYGAPFGELGELAEGDEVVVTTRQGAFTYEVEGPPTRIEPDEDDTALAAIDDAVLTLVTADPALVGGDRLVVRAVLDGDAAPPLQAAPLVVADDEIGIGGDASSVALLVIWSQLLVVAVVGTRLLYRRWSRWPTWLLTTPVLVALVFLVFESLDSLLPAAL